MKAAIHALKYDRLHPAARELGGMLAQAIAQLAEEAPAEMLVVPIPLHRSKYTQRGFNQARALAEYALGFLRKTHPGWRLTLANSLVYNGISGFTVDLSATSALGLTASATGNATTDSTNLVNALSVMFMHGQMPTQMSGPIIAHVATLTNIPERVRVATYLVITSSFYKIEH